MRLIDADKVKRAFIGNRYGTKAIEYVIDEAPTVKAITVEWIEEWGWKNGMSESMSLRVMIDDWRKENETNR